MLTVWNECDFTHSQLHIDRDFGWPNHFPTISGWFTLQPCLPVHVQHWSNFDVKNLRFIWWNAEQICFQVWWVDGPFEDSFVVCQAWRWNSIHPFWCYLNWGVLVDDSKNINVVYWSLHSGICMMSFTEDSSRIPRLVERLGYYYYIFK